MRWFDLKCSAPPLVTTSEQTKETGMQKSTPLDHLRRDDEPHQQQAQQANDLMDSVVHDLEGGGAGQPMPGYGGGGEYPQEMDPRMGPPPQGRPQGGPQGGFQHFGGGPGMDPRMVGGPPPGYGGPMHGGGPPPGMMGPGLENASFSQKLMAQAKEPLLVSVLVVILSSTQVQQLIARLLPMAAANPFIGLLIRAVIAGVAFWLLRRFIPN